MSIVTVMTATARPRLPQSRAWTARSAGQVATTIMVAQTVASRKGRSTQKLAAIKPPIATTASRIRVRSQDGGAADPVFRAHSCHPPPSALYSRTTASSSSRWLRTSPSSASKSWRSESRTSRYVVTPPV